jgi:CRP/FNR family transcriptional regulator, cyclic AMP receptor protein
MSVTTEELRAVQLLESIDERALRKLAGELRDRSYPAGRTIVEEGKGGVGFFLILSGTAVVKIRGEERGRLSAGDTFGELALLDKHADRIATIVAETDMRCATMTAWEFRPFVIGHPEVAWTMLQGVAERLRATEERVGTSAGAA